MFFYKAADVDGILELIKPKIIEVINQTNYGIDIDIKKHSRKRTLDQNRYLWGVYKNIIKFYEETGFIVDHLKVKFINSDFLHEYFKARFDLKTTTNLSTSEFSKYIDSIQNLMIEQTKGCYIAIYPEEFYKEF